MMVTFGNLVGVIGIVICLMSAVGRFYGDNSVLGFQAINMFIVGVGLMVFGCFAKISGR